MPGLSFTLPHWLYWVGLIVFPIIAMILSRRPQPEEKRYTLPLAYMIAVTGGILGLHRFYLKSLWGLIYLPIFLFILFANNQTHDARTVLSTYANQIRVAERTLDRDHFMTAQESMDFGLIDKVIDKRANMEGEASE